MQLLPLWKSVRFKIDYEYLGTLEMRWVDWVTRPVEWSNKNRGPCYHLDWSRIGTGIAKGLLGNGPQDWNWKLDVINSNLSPFHIGCCCCCCSLCSDSVHLCLHQAMKFNEVAASSLQSFSLQQAVCKVWVSSSQSCCERLFKVAAMVNEQFTKCDWPFGKVTVSSLQNCFKETTALYFTASMVSYNILDKKTHFIFFGWHF